MPWQEVSTVSLRKEFVHLAQAEEANIRALCRRFRVSPTTGYKWLGRFRATGVSALADQSRRPYTSPTRTPPEVERTILSARELHPAWGARKLRVWLLNQGHHPMPSPSTITAILGRHGCIDAAEAAKHRPWVRFERPAPNDLWQMDFKGQFPLAQGWCYPLTVLDDHSRFAVGLQACGDQRWPTVQQQLTGVFRRYGLPQEMLMDNGAPWGADWDHPYTPLTLWLLRLGIGVSHSRPYHPQTQGKEERFHRTLKAEVLQGRSFADLASCQEAFDPWRAVYNLERPHAALGLATPASRYQVSPRPFPEQLPAIEYGPQDQVRRVQAHGEISFQRRSFRVSKAFRGYPVALRATSRDGLWEVFFLSHRIAQLDLREAV